MADEHTDAPESNADATTVADAKVGVAALDSHVGHGYAFNIRMGADNIKAAARQVMEEKGVTLESEPADTFQWGEGPDHQAVTFITRLTGNGPRSFCVLTVADPSYDQTATLRDEIWEELTDRLGI